MSKTIDMSITENDLTEWKDIKNSQVDTPRDKAGKELLVVLFSLNDVLYGVDVHQVQGILEVTAITKVPNAPSYIKGVTNLRGDVIPVFDLRIKFNLNYDVSEEDEKMMVIGQGERATGIMVDSVLEVLSIAEDSIEIIPDLITGVNPETVLGVAKHKEEMIVLLDLVKIVTE